MSGRIKFYIPETNQYFTFTDDVLKLLYEYRQVDNRPESGGILFGEFKLPEISISSISLPNKNDHRSRFLFIPEKRYRRLLIKKNFHNGLHYIGEWHTHPQDTPIPSTLDLTSMQDCFIKSHHELHYFLLLIVGLVGDISSAWLSLHNKDNYIKLEVDK